MISVDQAWAILRDRSNGSLEAISGDKGGRAWLEGEWLLSELEALCIVVRHEAKDKAEGAQELIAIQQEQR